MTPYAIRVEKKKSDKLDNISNKTHLLYFITGIPQNIPIAKPCSESKVKKKIN